MALSVARRVSSLQPSATIAMANRAKALTRQGREILQFTLGEPDFDTPRQIKQAAIDALLAGQTKYMPTLGDPETRAVIAAKLRTENGLAGVTPEHIAITSGGKHALYNLFQCLFDHTCPGEAPREFILQTPSWVSYAPIARLAGAEVVEVHTTVESDFKMTPAQLRQAITPRTRAVMLNSPSNPCGTMYTESELRDIAAVLVDAAVSIAPDLVVISDEIYEKIIFGGIAHFSIGSIPQLAERTVTVNGLSKAYAMTGWRAGYAAAQGEFGLRLINALGTLQGQMSTNITSFVYPAIRAALTQCADDVESMRAAFARRAVVMTERLSGLPQVQTPRPTGAFYAFPDISAAFGKTTPTGRIIRSSVDFCEAMLEEIGLAAIPGEEFGGIGRNHIRLSFACSEETIHRGIDLMSKFLSDLR
ncbi:MAG: pyridoxal phosphate-dependent aminotransferase [Phycisphaeraceae bacterium]|nr:pyridoxal phosphate-dependent aminotransferase [Phycisphaeraceae bacterium]MCW5755287.1 pyridoxal phosphate-dependent aminotransferase [Phycisphaeraceae bacterium]